MVGYTVTFDGIQCDPLLSPTSLVTAAAPMFSHNHAN